ncbi:MAG: hypothetical protein AAF639_01180 [Chloroflexota bacterium]
MHTSLNQTEEPLSEELLQLQAELLAAIGGEPATGDDLIFEGITWDEYWAMSDEDQGKLWDEIGKQGPLTMEERDASPDALPAR